MRVGIAGTGFMGSTHAAGWAETDAKIVGFVAETLEEAEPLARQYAAKAYTDFNSLLRDVDIIDICTPTHLHASMIIEAASQRKHIICEKPLALSVEQASQAIKACRQAGVKLFVAHVVRFFPEYALAKTIVEQGKIGRLGTIRLLRGSYRPKKPVGNWFLDESKSGGILLDLMIHDFDYARWLAGDVESVMAKKISALHQNSPVDYGLVILKHRNGTISNIAGAWAYPPPVFRTGFEISGDGGMIEFDSDATAPIRNLVIRQAGEAPDVGLPSSPVQESPYTTEIKEFYAAIKEERTARVTAEDGLAAVQIAQAAIESARTGKAVYLTSLPEVEK